MLTAHCVQRSVNIIFISGSSSNTNRSKTEAMCKYHFISGPTNTHHTWDTVFSPNTSFWNSNQIQQRCLELESFFGWKQKWEMSRLLYLVEMSQNWSIFCIWWKCPEINHIFVSGGNIPKLIIFFVSGRNVQNDFFVSCWNVAKLIIFLYLVEMFQNDFLYLVEMSGALSVGRS